MGFIDRHVGWPILLIAFLHVWSVWAAEVVIDRGSEIVLPEGAPYATRLAAEELNFFLKGVLGEPLPVVTRCAVDKTSIILGGQNRYVDGYLVDVRGGVVRIIGNDADVAVTSHLPDEAPWQPCFQRGTLFGVYAFLERFAGVRMYFPGELGTCVPRAERIVVPEGCIEETPVFAVRRYGYADGTVAKEMLSGMDEISFKRLNWYRLRMETEHLACCHGAKTHCLSPATWEAIYTNACMLFAEGKGTVFDAMPKDGFTWLRHCTCVWCEANIPFSDTDTGFATDLVWRRTVELANRLKAKFPAARVSQMSYIPYVRIPTNEIPDNVDVFVARRGPWAEGTEIGERETADVRRWYTKLGRKVSLWNYPDKVDCWNLAMKDIPQVAPRAWARYYRAVAPYVTGAFAESESDHWVYNYLNYYVFSRLCWNPELDIETMLAEHHRLMFGAASNEMAEFFDTLESCWMEVVSKPYDTPLGPGVCKAPTEEELREKIYPPAVLMRLDSLLREAEAKVGRGSVEARRIALFRREYFAPLASRMSPILRVGLIADIHIGDNNDAAGLRQALRFFDAKKADVVLASGDLTDLGLLSELKEIATAWNEVFPDNRRSDGGTVLRLFHYGDHDTELNFKVRQREVVAKGRWVDYIPHIGVDIAWERAFGERFEPIVRRTVKDCEFTLVHFLPENLKTRFPQRIPPPGKARMHIFSQHRVYRGFFARSGCGDEMSWDDGTSLAFVTNVPNLVAVCGHAHISAGNDTSFHRGENGFAAMAVPSLFYQIETWLPKVKTDHGSHQALFLTAAGDRIVVERLDVRNDRKVGGDFVHVFND